MPKQMSPEHRPATLPKPECYIESPLTRARRIDSQNIWREQQLSKFFVSRSEFLKSSLNALREVKEHERASLGHQVAREFPIVDTREKSAPEKGEEDEPHFQLEILSGPPTPRIPMRPIQREAPLQPPNVIPNASTREVKNVASPKKTLDINPSKETAPIEQKKMPLIESKMVETKHSVEELVINPTDVFRLVSPLKKKSRLEDLPSIDSSIEAEFVGAFNPPPIALVNDIDVPLDMEEVSKQLLDDDVFNMTRKEPSVSKVIDKEEEARRERLKERQRLAIERKNMLMKKAQDSKIPKV
jgi:Arc/MetJ-type ribon-helix-helix transcriptional regulator